MSDLPTSGPRFRGRYVRAGAFLIEDDGTDAEADCPSVSQGGGAPDHTAADGSLYLRNDGTDGTTIYIRVAAAWVAISATAVSGTDFGSGGLATDAIIESTAAAGVLIDGLLIKDERIQPTGAGIATGDAGITLKDNLASAFDVKESTNSYLTFCTTNSAEAVQATKRLTVTDAVASGTARIVGGIAASDPSASTAITGATETLTNFDNTYELPADSLKVGTVVRIRASGLHTAATGAETHTLSVVAGAVLLGATGAIDPVANDVWDIEFEFTCRSVGATGTLVGSGRCISGPRATAAPALHFLATGTTSTSTVEVDTTGAITLAIAIDRQASATDGDSARMDRFHVEVIG